MSDYERPMFSATETLRTRRTRTAGVGPITLPRTVELFVLILGGIGALFGAMVGAMFGGGFESAGWGAFVGGGLTVFLIKFEPLRHHSLYRYIRLWMASRKGRAIVHDGRRVRMAIGVAVVDEGPQGSFQLRPGAVDVVADMYDERGVAR